MNRLAALFTFLVFVAFAPPVHADEVVFPVGSRVGLAPPPGMTTSENFYGYEDRANQAGIVMVPLPPDAYAELERTIGPDGLKKQGLTLESREPMTLSTGKAFLVIGRQEIDKVWIRKLILVASLPMATVLVTTQIPETVRDRYPDAVIRTALSSLTLRPTVPVEEQLAMVPFKVGELAGFKVAGVIPGRAIMLGEPVDEAAAAASAPAVPPDRTAYFRRGRARWAVTELATAKPSPATCSGACPISKASALPDRNRCGSATSRVTRSWRPPRTSTPAPT